MMLRPASIALAALVAAAPLAAQTIPDDAGIATRDSDDFRPIGGRIGSFILYPTLAADATATDNVLATEHDKRSDQYLTVRPSARLVADDEGRRINLTAYLQHDFHARLQREDTSAFGTEDYFRIGAVDSSRLELTASAQRLVDSREDIGNVPAARSPIHRGRLAADLSYTQVFNRLSLLAGFDAINVDYANARTRSDTLIDQHFRDFHALGGRIEARYDLVNGLIAVAKTQYDVLRYPFGPGSTDFDPTIDRNRDSYRVRAEGGLGASITNILYGEVTVGYLDRRFKRQALGVRSSGGFSFSADVLWNVSPITTLRLTAARDFLESSSRQIAGYRTTGGKLTVDFALTPALVLSASGRFAHIVPIGPTATRDEYGGEGQITYSISRRFSINADYRHSGRNADPELSPFDSNYIIAGIKATF